MLQSMLACVILACVATAQEDLIHCNDDSQCYSGRYCEANVCRKCLRCEDLNREPPSVTTSCIKSVVECGACFNGFVDDHSGILNAGCVRPGDGPGVSPYVWLGLGIGILLTFVIGLLIYWYRHTESVKISASASVSTPYLNGGAVASAPLPPHPLQALQPPQSSQLPQPPPPYNLHYDTASPAYEEESSPLVKDNLQLRLGDAEHAGNQAARVYNNPAYVRVPLPEETDVEYVDEDRRSPLAFHDEDTMESIWRPSSDNSNTNDNGTTSVGASEAEGASTLLPPAVRRAATSDIGPPAKIPCVAQDSNNNKNGDASSGDEGSSSAQGRTSVTLNFNLNVNANAVQQLNNVTL